MVKKFKINLLKINTTKKIYVYLHTRRKFAIRFTIKRLCNHLESLRRVMNAFFYKKTQQV